MDATFNLTPYFPIFLYLAFILAFVVLTLVLAYTIGPRRDTPVKLMTYESGMDPVGDARQRFDVKFYLVAIMFLVFDVELLFLYPWAVAAYRPTQEGGLPGLPVKADEVVPEIYQEYRFTVFVSILVFLILLVVAYVYDWRKGVFKWR